MGYSIKYADDIQILEDLYSEVELKAIENQKKKVHIDLELSAFVDELNGIDFYNKIVAEDLQCFLSFPGMLEVSEFFREKVLTNNRECAIYGIRAHELREDSFKVTHNHYELELTNLRDDIMVNSLLNEMRRGARDIFNLLIKNEMQLVDQIEQIFQDFERMLNEMVILFLEQIRFYMTECRDLSQKFAEKLNDIAMNTLEEISKGQLETDLSEEILRLLVDKDNLVSTLSSSHDCHMSTIDKKEDYINVGVNNYVMKLLSHFSSVETERNRLRIGEIDNLYESFTELIDEIEENLDK
ncbi:Leucine-rich repeat-containing protein 48 [Oopsacas minuta]|uniref:Leucine-rich repeat-containing protein 48 n=1 Tax=Oopsacas minuta TaxID=111878 RepID=A0AAV7KCJ0_9METZ|nr:Leucine-rich repeat-containing protein 48 [Oopsacas minuta]